jgi:hypothetical protein
MSYKLGSNRGNDSFTSFKKKGLINCDNPPCDPYDPSKSYDPSKKVIIEGSNVSNNKTSQPVSKLLSDGGAKEIEANYKGTPKQHEIDQALKSNAFRNEMNKKYNFKEDTDYQQYKILNQKYVDNKGAQEYIKTKLIKHN